MTRSTVHVLAIILVIALQPDFSRAEEAREPSSWSAPATITIHGTEYGPVQLRDGTWEGEPYVEGGASRPRVGLAKDFMLSGDVDGDGQDESLYVVWQSSGGSGTFNYAALVDSSGDSVENTATVALGDRVRVLGGSMGPGRIELQVLEHDEDDPACCPTRHATRVYDAQLQPVSQPEQETE